MDDLLSECALGSGDAPQKAPHNRPIWPLVGVFDVFVCAVCVPLSALWVSSGVSKRALCIALCVLNLSYYLNTLIVIFSA